VLEDMGLSSPTDSSGLPSTLPSKLSIRMALRYYTNNIYYQKSIIDCSKRIDLYGNEVGDIT
jgi:sRNA-binding protein